MNELDQRILLALRASGDLSDPVGPPWLQRAAVDFTALGGHTVLVVLVMSVAGLLFLQHRRSSALWLILVTTGAMLLNHGLKAVFARARPELVDHLVVVVTPSFPSGHALMSAAVYLILAVFAGRGLSKSARRYLFCLALLLTLLIGTSRVYLGVHWPSDVLGGWIIGSLWAWGCWRVANARIAHEGAGHGNR